MTTKKIKGFSIFQDERGRNVYYDRLFKKAYLIQDKNLNQYYFYQNRYLFVAIIAILVATYITNYAIIVGLALVGILVLEVLFRVNYLKNLVELQNFKPVHKQTNNSISKETKNKLLIKAVAFVLLSILLVLNVMTTEYDQIMVAFSYIVSIGAFAVALFNFNEFRKSK